MNRFFKFKIDVKDVLFTIQQLKELEDLDIMREKILIMRKELN